MGQLILLWELSKGPTRTCRPAPYHSKKICRNAFSLYYSVWYAWLLLGHPRPREGRSNWVNSFLFSSGWSCERGHLLAACPEHQVITSLDTNETSTGPDLWQRWIDHVAQSQWWGGEEMTKQSKTPRASQLNRSESSSKSLRIWLTGDFQANMQH